MQPIPDNEQMHRVYYLVAAFINNRLTPAERQELDQWVAASPENLLFFEEATDERNIEIFRAWYGRLDMERAGENLLQKIRQRERKKKPAFSLALAACLILLAGIGISIFFLTRQQKPAHNIQATTTQATLQLADGRTILLDSLAGATFTAKGFRLSLEGQQLTMDALPGQAPAAGMNTLYVPRGKQYSLLLPDGTQVELNAGSSLQFPSTFDGTERKVALAGEAFFGVASSAGKKFIVSARDATISVSGTAFNISAYEEETAITTTLVEGSVTMAAGRQEITLLPGQQASLHNNVLTRYAQADLHKATAWRTGQFIFRQTPIDEILRTLQRWYDIEIEDKTTSKTTFSATFDKSWPLEKITGHLQETGRVQFHMKNNRLTATN